MTFNDAMQLTRTVSTAAAFSDEEAKAYYEILDSLDPGSTIVEIGLEFGRSSSIALQVAKSKKLYYHGVDPFLTSEALHSWIDMAYAVGGPFSLHVMNSHRWDPPQPISALLIDGDHEYEAVYQDCLDYLYLVTASGYALFHDFGSESGVQKAVTEYFEKHPGWNFHNFAGTLGIWQKGANE
jgi:hypothetical protein